MASPKAGKLKLLIILIPIFWILFSELELFKPFFKPLANMAMDWRYRVRGEVKVPEVKVAYADIDGAAISMMGERPWSRNRFGQLAEILFENGKARAVGFDFIFSEFTNSELVPKANLRGSDYQLSEVIRKYPNIVLAANYTGTQLPFTLEEQELDHSAEYVEPRYSYFPLDYIQQDLAPEERISNEETFPEMPTFPIVSNTYGTVGLISVDENMSGGVVPRWIPAYAKAKGPFFTLNQLEGYKNFYETVDEESIQTFGDSIFVIDKEGDVLASMPYEQEHTFYHLAIELALKYHGLGHDAVTIEEDVLLVKDPKDNVLIEMPLEHGQVAEVNWFSEWNNSELNPRASVADIFQHHVNLLEGNEELKEDARRFFQRFNDAIVLVGPVDPTLQDVAPTPFNSSPVPKVGVHGNMIKTLFSGMYINHVGPAWRIAILIVLTAGVAFLGLKSGQFSLFYKTGSVLLLIAYICLVFYAFAFFHLVIPLIAPVASAITTSAAFALVQLLLEEKQRGRIKGMFGTYLSPELVNNMVESGEEPKLGGADVLVTAFFSDVQSFSSFSEVLEPAQLVALMNEYLTAMTNALMEEGAYVDKYIGDAIVAMFNAPVQMENHALRACLAAAHIQQIQSQLREKWGQEGDKWPSQVSAMRTRIGINTGQATVGNMGSEQRFNYTMMGDTVNLAARCESGAKSVGVYTMVTGDTKSHVDGLEGSDALLFRFVDRWQVKGRSKPVDMYEIVGLCEKLPESATECVRAYEAALQLYFKQQWSEALAGFEKAAQLELHQPGETPGIATNPSLVLLERCREMQANPPGEGWDGVYVMKTK